MVNIIFLNDKRTFFTLTDVTYYLLLQEPSLFAVAKLLETGLVNLHRVEVLWRPVTNHLLEVGGAQMSSHKSLL